MPYKDKEENRKYQREWARKNSKTRKENQISHKRRKQIVEDAKKHVSSVIKSFILYKWILSMLIHHQRNIVYQNYCRLQVIKHYKKRLTSVLLYVQTATDSCSMDM